MSTYHEDIGSDAIHIKQQLFDALTKAQRIIITTHVNPDGDAIGSSLGLWHWLRSLGKQVQVILPNNAPANMEWMPGIDAARTWNPDLAETIAEADLLLVLDLNAVSRLGELGNAIRASRGQIVNIDHHTHPESFASIAWIDTNACSTCVMIAEFVLTVAGAAALSEECAICLYTGIMTDTGSFRFPRTTATVFRIVADLVEKGADPVRAYDNVMNQGSIGRTQLLGKTLSQMQVLADGRLCVMCVTMRDMEEHDCRLEDIEGFVQQTLTLRGVVMGILIVELLTEIKVSFRSKGDAYVRDLAASLGGGGHVYAAGARVVERSLSDVRRYVTTEAVDYLEKLS